MKKKHSKYNTVCKKDLSEEKKADDNDADIIEKYMYSIDIREKRIAIVFKVIYVFAIFWAALFMTISEDMGEELSTTYTVEVCAIAFLFCLILKMIMYIFNELKCFKLNNEELPQQQIVKTEKCYTRIFKYFSTGGITSFFMAVVVEYMNVYLTQNILRGVFISSIILVSVIYNAHFKKYEQFWQTFSDIVWTIMIMSVMFIVKFGEMV